eukprot:scaffold61936_cov32-Tisochrysis_lutea.AAC.2
MPPFVEAFISRHYSAGTPSPLPRKLLLLDHHSRLPPNGIFQPSRRALGCQERRRTLSRAFRSTMLLMQSISRSEILSSLFCRVSALRNFSITFCFPTARDRISASNIRDSPATYRCLSQEHGRCSRASTTFLCGGSTSMGSSSSDKPDSSSTTSFGSADGLASCDNPDAEPKRSPIRVVDATGRLMSQRESKRGQLTSVMP